MRSSIETGLNLTPERINNKHSPESLPDESPITKAVGMLTAEGEPALSLDRVTLIPVEVDPGNSISIRFHGSQGEESGIKKGVNFHLLRIQKTMDTLIPPGHIDSARSLGYDVSENSLVGIVNSRRPTFFHPDHLIVSEETTSLLSKEASVDVPLYVPVTFQGDKGQGVIIVTRYPGEKIDVKHEKTLDFARGLKPEEIAAAAALQPSEIPATGEPVLVSSEQPPSSQPTVVESSLSTPDQTILTGGQLDSTVDGMNKAWNQKKYASVLDVLANPKSTSNDRHTALTLFKNTLLSTTAVEDHDFLFSKVAQRITELQDRYDTEPKVNGQDFVYEKPLIGNSIWKVNLRYLQSQVDQYKSQFSQPENHNEPTYLEFISRWFLINYKWAQHKKWF